MVEFFLRNRKPNLLHLLQPTPTSYNPHNEANLWAICKEFGVGLIFETTPETYSKLLPINMVSIILNPYIRYSIQLYEHQR